MAYSQVSYAATGSTTQFAVPFAFIARSHVTATVNGGAATFNWLSDSLIDITSHLAAALAGKVVKLKRRTSYSARLVDYQPAGIAQEEDFDADSFQAFYMAQEAIDEAADIRSALDSVSLGGIAPIAASIVFGASGSLVSTNVQTAIQELDSETQTALSLKAPLAAPSFTGDARFGGTLYRGGGSLFPSEVFQIDYASTNGQARFRHSTGLGFSIAQASAGGTVRLYNQDNDSLQLGGGNATQVEINPSGLIDFKNGSGSLRMNGTITRSEVVGSTLVSLPFFDSVVHTGPRVPDIFSVVMQCISTDLGYAVGDEIPFTSLGFSTGIYNSNTWANATTVGARIISGNLYVINKGSSAVGQLANSKWRAVYRCIWL